ncbi:hypothetical protein G5714_019036 [Onychostoma macrolepis]|uniref:Uncharacterized protein n=1 Tax=Onychostoma macrolepis TaxID=369639 RepID=A0A7J6C0W2_9TELE|nr:hypothetical protein G5714_019036 [Onychostoma macrolepis]
MNAAQSVVWLQADVCSVAWSSCVALQFTDTAEKQMEECEETPAAAVTVFHYMHTLKRLFHEDVEARASQHIPMEEPVSTTATQPPAGGGSFPLAPRPLRPCISIPVTSTPTAKEALLVWSAQTTHRELSRRAQNELQQHQIFTRSILDGRSCGLLLCNWLQVKRSPSALTQVLSGPEVWRLERPGKIDLLNMSARTKGLLTGLFSQGNNQSRREMKSRRWAKFSLSFSRHGSGLGQEGTRRISDNGPVWTCFSPVDTFSYLGQSCLKEPIPSAPA